MKHRSVLFVLMLAALLQSCSSPEQMTGTYIGSSMGGMLGSAIGGATNGRRGAYTGKQSV